MNNIKAIISGGGTGGHIFPAIAIANSLKRKIPDIDILFVGAKDKMEMEKIPAAGYKIIGLWIGGLQRKLSFKNLLLPFQIYSSIRKSKQIIKEFKPNIVIGTGGYASGPILKVAADMGIPTVIQEQNSYPGITNRLLAKKVDLICVAYEGMEKYFPKDKIILTGNPVREDIINCLEKREEAINYFELDEFKKTLLVIGGSLGAKSINEVILKNLKLFELNNIQLIWQTGKNFYEKAESAISQFNNAKFRVYPFITRMDLAYAAADLIVSRAGAITVSEISIAGKPAIFVPSPNVAEDHQTKNAMALVNKKAAMMIKDDEVHEKLGMAILTLIVDKTMKSIYADNIKKFAFYDATENITNQIINLLKK